MAVHCRRILVIEDELRNRELPSRQSGPGKVPPGRSHSYQDRAPAKLPFRRAVRCMHGTRLAYRFSLGHELIPRS
jgi:hypothetical protein